MAGSGRVVSRGKDGRLVVRRVVSNVKKRRILVDVGDGKTQAQAARDVGVSPRDLARELKQDVEFAVEMAVSLEGYAIVLDDRMRMLSEEGLVREFNDRKTGVLIRREVQPIPRLVERHAEAHDPRYRRNEPPQVVIVNAISTQEFQHLRAVGREDAEAMERLAVEMAVVERERDGRLEGAR